MVVEPGVAYHILFCNLFDHNLIQLSGVTGLPSGGRPKRKVVKVVVKRKVQKKHDGGTTPRNASRSDINNGSPVSTEATSALNKSGADSPDSKLPEGGEAGHDEVPLDGTPNAPNERKEPPEDIKEALGEPEQTAPTLQPVKSEHGAVVDKTIDVLVSMGYKHDEAEQATLKVFETSASGPNVNRIDEIMDLIEDTRSGKHQETQATEVPPNGPEATPSEMSEAWQEHAADSGFDDYNASYWQPNSWDSYGWGSCWDSYYRGWYSDETSYKRSWSAWSAESTPSHVCESPSSSQIQSAMDRLNTQDIEEADPSKVEVDFAADLAKEMAAYESQLEDWCGDIFRWTWWISYLIMKQQYLMSKIIFMKYKYKINSENNGHNV